MPTGSVNITFTRTRGSFCEHVPHALTPHFSEDSICRAVQKRSYVIRLACEPSTFNALRKLNMLVAHEHPLTQALLRLDLLGNDVHALLYPEDDKALLRQCPPPTTLQTEKLRNQILSNPEFQRLTQLLR